MTATTTAVLPGSTSHRVWKSIIFAAIFLLTVFIARQFSEPSEFPKALSEPFAFVHWVDEAESWLKVNYRDFTRMIAGVIEGWLYAVEDFLIDSPWPFVLLLLVLPALAYGGLPLGLFTLLGGLFWGAVGMWEPAMQTLALMGMAVILSVIFGVLLGILCAQSNQFEALLKPVLDTMQTMPAFVYLLPAVFFFGIGGPPAIIATMIYALPPVVRLTSLGIRQIPEQTLEAARSFGASRLQILLKVQIPMSLPSILLGINQTIMMALGLVVLATFIGAEGLGSEVWKAISRLKVGWSLEAGLCIVFMAIIFDRLSLAIGRPGKAGPGSETRVFRLLPQSLEVHPWAGKIEAAIDVVWRSVGGLIMAAVRAVGAVFYIPLDYVAPGVAARIKQAIEQHRFFFGGMLVLIAILLVDRLGVGFGDFPEALSFSMREPVDAFIAQITVNPFFIAFTKGFKALIYLYLLHPLDVYLTQLPWYIIIVSIGIVSWVSAGPRLAIICVALLVFIGACDLWEEAMLTLSSVLVSVAICFLMGLPLGIAAAHSRRFDLFLRPVLDAMQTMPSFVYLIPVLMFFGGNVVSAVIATVIYALPPVIRLTTLGISQIPVTYTEVANSFGSNTRQTLYKVKMPMALPSIMLGLNQAVMMGLAMQVVTPLIGGGGLGREVFNALNTSNTGAGLASGTGIVLLAIILDRLSQAWTQNQRQALGV